jgi:hypothetical protein
MVDVSLENDQCDYHGHFRINLRAGDAGVPVPFLRDAVLY